MFDRFLAKGRVAPTESILDVGATSDRTYTSSNYVEAWYPHKKMLTAAGLDDASFLEQQYPGVRFVFASGKALPFADGSFDVVHSSAVIEHVGSRAEQARFVFELNRVARRMTCITTPNRWFPVEVHTSLPLLHWLPPSRFRGVLRELGLEFFAEEGNLNLLDASHLLKLRDGLESCEASISRVRLAGWTSNLMMFIFKKAASADAR